jgi:hypothetical protein
MKQTAVEIFFEDLVHLGYIEYPDECLVQDRLKLALELEKQQHKKTWFDSTAQFDNAAEMTYKKEFEQYYSETYKKPTE